MDIQKWIDERVLLFDGAMGTMLQESGLPVGELPDLYNLTHPEIVTAIHRKYVEAGADVVTTNTFQSSSLKLPPPYTVEQVVCAGVNNAKASGATFVALDIGPLGQLMEPIGTLRFDEAYRCFQEQMIAGEKAGADCILIETISDSLEAKIAILAAKENTSLPVFCTMTYQEDGRTFVGNEPVGTTLMLQGLGVAAQGINCSLGPAELGGLVEQILPYASVPVMVQPNAGLPQMKDGQTVYTISPEEFANYTMEMVRAGVRIVGGCCGTTPAFIKALREGLAGFQVRPINPKPVTAVTSPSKTVFFTGENIGIIGERINPTGKKKLKEALRTDQLDYIIGEAIDQTNAGADILDINVGLPEIDEPAMMRRVIREVQSISALPLQIDSADPLAIEAGLRIYNGRPLVNSVNGKAESMAQIFPLVKKYGAVVVGLTLDEKGIPETAEERYQIARRIVEEGAKYGIPPADILIDCLVLTASAQQSQVLETLKAIPLVKNGLGVKTVLGVSNVSFGLPGRELLNATFLAAAFGVGLDAPILNPCSRRYMEVVEAFRVLNGEDDNASSYLEIQKKSGQIPAGNATQASKLSLDDIIIQGRKEEAGAEVQALLATLQPLEIIDQFFVPALNTVGKQFETGELFLPQLMRSAEAVRQGFLVIEARMDALGQKRVSKGKIILATVKGDIHDIGKNIVAMLLKNYGYDVIDLGKDVPIELIVGTAKAQNITLIGLSALMTTTVKNMRDTIDALKKTDLPCAIMVGGAVLNPEYARLVGADFYAKDAMEGVAIANRFFAK